MQLGITFGHSVENCSNCFLQKVVSYLVISLVISVFSPFKQRWGPGVFIVMFEFTVRSKHASPSLSFFPPGKERERERESAWQEASHTA